ncbi:MAG: SDR family oxidoreductase [Tagaea sp.]|nr:SDR family oxidoreductase [Tagaea sp.]
MDPNIGGKSAIVTGASRGIGLAIAEKLSASGVNVTLVARSAGELEAHAARLSRTTPAHAHAADLRAPDAAEAAVAAALARFGRLDFLVNNAGATKRGDFAALTDDDFLDGFALKFHGYVRMTRAAWPALKASGGGIVNIVGAGGRTAAGDFTIGGAVNAALFNFTKAIAQPATRDGIRVNAINPGWIETDRLKARLAQSAKDRGLDEASAKAAILAELKIARFGQPAEIGDLVCVLLGPHMAYVQGALIDCDGGLTRAL